ncbi:hypothetical protein PMHK_03090 [Pseudomonas sp. MHK4]
MAAPRQLGCGWIFDGQGRAGSPPQWIDVVISSLWRPASYAGLSDDCGCLATYPCGRNINTANGGKFNTSDNACPWLGVTSAVAPPLLP